MGRTRDGDGPRAATATSLSSFPSPSSSSSSDFEFTVALSPSSKRPCAQLCPADELFYKGQLLPLHLSPRISMVRTLLLASSSTSSSSDTTTTASRDSNGSTSSSSFSAADFLPECDSSRPSSVTEEEARRVASFAAAATASGAVPKRGKYLSSFATRLSSVFLHRGSKKDAGSGADLVINIETPAAPAPSSAKKANISSSSAAKEVIKKCVKKVKPLYEKLSSLQQKQTHLNGPHHPPPQPPPPPPPQQQHQHQKKTFSFSIRKEKFGSASSRKHAADPEGSSITHHAGGIYGARHPLSFSGNLGKPRRKQWAASCPSSMRSSPSHSGLLSVGGVGGGFPAVEPPSSSSFLLSSSSSSMEELQSAIQGAIAHCKSSMNQSTNHSNKKPPTGALISSSSSTNQ